MACGEGSAPLTPMLVQGSTVYSLLYFCNIIKEMGSYLQLLTFYTLQIQSTPAYMNAYQEHLSLLRSDF